MDLPDDIERYLRATGPGHDDVQQEMVVAAAERQFPIIGPDAGGVLRSYARATNAMTVFEFGSGFGYSATWFLQGMPEEGTVVLTEFDEEEVEMAKTFFQEAGLTHRAIFEHGDAMDIVERYNGPFDLVLIDHQKEQYADAFEAVRDKLPVGSVVIADNVISGAVSLEDVLPYVEGKEGLPDESRARGIVRYLETVRADEDFHTVVLPVGNGLAVTTRERVTG